MMLGAVQDKAIVPTPLPPQRALHSISYLRISQNCIEQPDRHLSCVVNSLFLSYCPQGEFVGIFFLYLLHIHSVMCLNWQKQG